MGQIRIVTDSTADIPKEIQNRLNITVVPLKVRFGDAEYTDGEEMTSTEFYQKLKVDSNFPRSSQPSPAEFATVYKDLAQEADHIISIHISRDLSGTLQAAKIAQADLPDLDITVIDTRTVSLGLGMIVIKAAEFAIQGTPKAKIIDFIEKAVSNTEIYFIVDTLEHLKRGGRIGKAVAFLGSLLNVKPILSTDEGVVISVDKARGRQKAISKLLNLADLTNRRNPTVAIVHADNLPEAEDLKEKVLAIRPDLAITVGELGAVVGTHAGPGTLGICVMDEGF